jgi:hypothetical protein
VSNALTRDVIIGVKDSKMERVEVPEWGGHVYVRTLTGRERDAFEAETMKTRKGQKPGEGNYDNFRARFVALTMCDESGELLFKTRQEVAVLGSKSVAALQRVFIKAQELNGMSDQVEEELAEDFDEAPDEDSTSDSHPISE